MDAVCRLCAQNSSSLTSVFTFQRGRLLSDMIQLICPIKIDPADEIKQICQKCLKIVLDAHELRERSVRSDIKFKTEALSSHSIEKVNVKQESDPFQSEIVIENEEMDFSDIEDEEEVLSDASDSDLRCIIPLIPQKKFSKYQYEVVDRKYKCPAENCGRLFSQTTNINRHINTDHKGEKINYVKKKEKVRKDEKEFTCYVCGISFQNNSCFNRHMKNKHPEYIPPRSPVQPSDFYTATCNELDSLGEPTALSLKYFQRSKEKYLKFFEVVDEREGSFNYKCRICMMRGRGNKVWAQNTKNGGTSNLRRHLNVTHKALFDEFQRFEGTELVP